MNICLFKLVGSVLIEDEVGGVGNLCINVDLVVFVIEKCILKVNKWIVVVFVVCIGWYSNSLVIFVIWIFYIYIV